MNDQVHRFIEKELRKAEVAASSIEGFNKISWQKDLKRNSRKLKRQVRQHFLSSSKRWLLSFQERNRRWFLTTKYSGTIKEYPGLTFDEAIESSLVQSEYAFFQHIFKYDLMDDYILADLQSIELISRTTAQLEAVSVFDPKSKSGGVIFDTSLLVLCDNISRSIVYSGVLNLWDDPTEMEQDPHPHEIIDQIKDACKHAYVARKPMDICHKRHIPAVMVSEGTRLFIAHHEFSHLYRDHYNPSRESEYCSRVENIHYASLLKSRLENYDLSLGRSISLNSIISKLFYFAREIDADESGMFSLLASTLEKTNDAETLLNLILSYCNGAVIAVWINDLIERYVRFHISGISINESNFETRHVSGGVCLDEIQRVLDNNQMWIDVDNVAYRHAHPDPGSRINSIVMTVKNNPVIEEFLTEYDTDIHL